MSPKAPKKPAKAKNNPSLQEDLQELESLVAQMEDSNASLDVAMTQFARAVEIAESLKKRLSEAEMQIDELSSRLAEE